MFIVIIIIEEVLTGELIGEIACCDRKDRKSRTGTGDVTNVYQATFR